MPDARRSAAVHSPSLASTASQVLSKALSMGRTDAPDFFEPSQDVRTLGFSAADASRSAWRFKVS